MMGVKIKVMIVDDHTIVRDGMKSLLETSKDIHVIDEAENGEALLEKLTLKNILPDVILMDITMPKLNGLDTTRKLAQMYPNIGVLFLSMHEEPEYVVQSMQEGGSGYLLKNVEKEELILAIQTVAKGEKYINATMASKISEGIKRMHKTKDDIELSTREKEVLQWVAAGKSTKQIADQLFLSARTVETHRVNMMKKLKVNNSAELIKIAIERKIIQ